MKAIIQKKKYGLEREENVIDLKIPFENEWTEGDEVHFIIQHKGDPIMITLVGEKPREEKQMAKYYTMKECFDECGDEDIPFIEDGFNSTWMKTKKYLIRNYQDYRATVGEMISDKWQIKRAAPKVVDSEWYWKNKVPIINNHTTNIFDCRKRDIIDAFKYADQNGQLREWLRPEQVELREAVRKWFGLWGDFENYLYCQSEPPSKESIAMYKALENLKPPVKQLTSVKNS